MDHPVQLCVVCEEFNVTLDDTRQVIHVYQEEQRSQHRSLRNATRYVSPLRSSSLPAPPAVSCQSERPPSKWAACLRYHSSEVCSKAALRGTESNAFWKSRYITSTGLPPSSSLVKVSRTSSSWELHKRFGRNPCWWSDSRQFMSVGHFWGASARAHVHTPLYISRTAEPIALKFGM